MLRLAFFGTPRFAVPTLQGLLGAGHDVAAVITQPDRPRGRGQHVSEPPVKDVARHAGVPVWQPSRLKDEAWLATFRDLRVDLAIVAAYGRILPQVLLDQPPLGFLNVHASLLPRYRGASPVQRAVMNGDSETGVTIMRIVLALDAGPMLASRKQPIGPDDSSEVVEHDLSQLGAALLLTVLGAVEAGTAIETPQDETAATYAPRLTKEEGLVDWQAAAPILHNRVRGLRPWPQAYTFLDGTRLTIVRGRVADLPPGTPPPPGTVLAGPRDRLLISAGEGTAFELLEIQPENRRAMPVRDFLAGHRLAPGARLGGPP